MILSAKSLHAKKTPNIFLECEFRKWHLNDPLAAIIVGVCKIVFACCHEFHNWFAHWNVLHQSMHVAIFCPYPCHLSIFATWTPFGRANAADKSYIWEPTFGIQQLRVSVHVQWQSHDTPESPIPRDHLFFALRALIFFLFRRLISPETKRNSGVPENDAFYVTLKQAENSYTYHFAKKLPGEPKSSRIWIFEKNGQSFKYAEDKKRWWCLSLHLWDITRHVALFTWCRLSSFKFLWKFDNQRMESDFQPSVWQGAFATKVAVRAIVTSDCHHRFGS